MTGRIGPPRRLPTDALRRHPPTRGTGRPAKGLDGQPKRRGRTDGNRVAPAPATSGTPPPPRGSCTGGRHGHPYVRSSRGQGRYGAALPRRSRRAPNPLPNSLPRDVAGNPVYAGRVGPRCRARAGWPKATCRGRRSRRTNQRWPTCPKPGGCWPPQASWRHRTRPQSTRRAHRPWRPARDGRERGRRRGRSCRRSCRWRTPPRARARRRAARGAVEHRCQVVPSKLSHDRRDRGAPTAFGSPGRVRPCRQVLRMAAQGRGQLVDRACPITLHALAPDLGDPPLGTPHGGGEVRLRHPQAKAPASHPSSHRLALTPHASMPARRRQPADGNVNQGRGIGKPRAGRRAGEPPVVCPGSHGARRGAVIAVASATERRSPGPIPSKSGYNFRSGAQWELLDHHWRSDRFHTLRGISSSCVERCVLWPLTSARPR